jgi:dihydroneopterin aldolase
MDIQGIGRMTSKIEIHNLEIQAYHGVLSQEHVVGNLYSIDLSITTDLSVPMESDELTDTVDYASAVRMIQEEMDQPSQLLEHVAGRILKRIHRTWLAATGADLRIAKLAPPIEGKVESCAVHVQVEFGNAPDELI